ncbi:MAG: HAD family hydrolase [Bacteroidales bacterium]
MNKLNLIFDLDGVIANTGDQHQDAWFKFCEKHRLHITEKMFRDKLFGRTSHEIMEILFGRGIGENESYQLTEEKEKLYRDLAKGQLKPLPGLPGFLEKVNAHHIPVCVASSAPHENVVFTLRETKVRQYFGHIIAAEDIRNSKPHPEIFLKAAEALAAPPSNCIVFEDSYAGVEAGLRAKMKVVAVASTHHEHELKHAHLTISDFLRLEVNHLMKL